VNIARRPGPTGRTSRRADEAVDPFGVTEFDIHNRISLQPLTFNMIL
jgi:hypothetical protein